MQGERGRIDRPFLPIWREALGDESGAAFREVVAPHVRLEGSIFATPIDGREKVGARGPGPTVRGSHPSSPSTAPDWSTNWHFTIARLGTLSARPCSTKPLILSLNLCAVVGR